MKRILLISLTAAFSALASPAHAAGKSGHQHGHMDHSAMPEASPAIEGVVRKVDKAGGRLTVAHGPLPNGMPGMTMSFKVKEAAWLDRLRADDRIRFRSAQVDGAMTIVELEPAR